MKILLFTLFLTLVGNFIFAQDIWFRTYSDSLGLMEDAHLISNQFHSDIKKIESDSRLNLHIIVRTTPSLIYIYRDTVHLSLWRQVIPELKHFFGQLTGSPDNAKEVFGLFFNGFYLPHELGHGFQFSVEDRNNLFEYDMEYFANTVAMLWWRKHNRDTELRQCYEYAKMMMADYPNPFPEGVDYKVYFSENYNNLLNDMELFAKIYPYIQFNQFIEIYEDTTLPDFDIFIGDYLTSKR